MSDNTKNKWDAGDEVSAADLIELQPGGVVSRTIVKKKTGTVTVFAFDEGEGLSEHTAPFEALLMCIEGEGEVTVSGTPHHLSSGEMIRLPAGEPHGVKAVTPFKMMLVMIRE